MNRTTRIATYMFLIFSICGCDNPENTDFKVMTFNIRFGTADDGDNSWPLRNNLVTQTIEDFSPDILGLQEALHFQLEEINRAFPVYKYAGVGRDDGREAGEFTAILFDSTRFHLLEQETFWFSDSPSVPGSISWGNLFTRICTWSLLSDTRTNSEFYVYNLHWDHRSQPSREKSAELLIKKIKTRADPELDFMVMGDFNVDEDNSAFLQLFSDSLIVLKDTFRDVHPTVENVGTFNGFRGETAGPKVDAILTTGGFETISAQIVRTNVNGQYPSDHFPVTAKLSFAR